MKLFKASKFQALFSLTVLGVQGVFGAVLFQSFHDLLDSLVEYDFIVVGGGTAGAVVASRLAENQDFRILVIEAGPSNGDVFATHPPGLFRELTKTRVDWNYTTTAQRGLNGRSLGYSRAKMLGGCSSHNGMFWSRGSKDDWDRWARVTGNEALSWDRMLPVLLRYKVERWTQDSENQPEDGHFNPSVHSRDGKVFLSAPYSNHPFNDMILETAKELKDEFPFLLDINDGRPIGIGWKQFTIDNHAERSSSASAYLVNTGKNVHILLNTYVTRMLPVGDNTDFREVEFVIDSQGVIGTPHMLLNSGIGKHEELEALGIRTLVDNPSVGKNMTDQPAAFVTFATNIQNTDFHRDTALAQWNNTRTGPMGLSGHLNHVVYVRLPGDASPFSQGQFVDPTGGDNSPHIEFSLSQISSSSPTMTVDIGSALPELALTTIQLLVINLHPLSRGYVALNNSNPLSRPIIDFGLLTQDEDIAILREGIRSARRMYAAPVFKDRVFGTVLPAANVTRDEDLDMYIRKVAAPFLHAVGTAAMSPRNANWGVVNPNFRVKGTSGLRVVDASVINYAPSGHSQAAVYGFAEHASEQIAMEWK